MGKAEWMSGNYGVMVHYLPTVWPQSGEKKMTFNQMADNFDVKKFVAQVKEMGGKWIIFPFGQNDGHYWSYNSVIEMYHPDSCSKRDLVLELAIEAKKQGLRFIAYIPTEADVNVVTLRTAFGWDLSSDKKVFMERWMKLIAYYGEKFGELLDGWWFDGCYDSQEKDFMRTHDWNSSRFNEKEWFEAARMGNPERISAMCNSANRMDYVFEQEEYLAGESSNELEFYPWEYDSRAKQWHALIVTDCFWMHSKEGEIESPKFKNDELLEYTKKCLDAKGAISWNIGIYEDGTMAEKTVEQIKWLNGKLNKQL